MTNVFNSANPSKGFRMTTLLICIHFLAFHTQAQDLSKPVYIYDFKTGLLDSMIQVEYDSLVQADHTDFYIGGFNSSLEFLESEFPVVNTLLESQFTFKEKAASQFDLTNYPLRTSVKLFAVDEGEPEHRCSGSFISSKHILTAAHCLLDLNTNILSNDSFFVCPIYDNGAFSLDFDCSAVSKLYFIKDWNITEGEDIAVLELEESIGFSTGWIGIGFEKSESALMNNIYYKFSYPGESSISELYNGDTLYYSYGEANFFTDYDIGIMGGQGIPGESGSSLISVDHGSNYISYGVLNWSTNLRHARISDKVFYTFKKIIENDVTLHNISSDPLDEVIVFPNPTTIDVSLNYNTFKGPVSDLEILDSWGRSLLGLDVYELGMKIDLSSFPAGSYYLKMVRDDTVIVRKIIKL